MLEAKQDDDCLRAKKLDRYHWKSSIYRSDNFERCRLLVRTGQGFRLNSSFQNLIIQVIMHTLFVVSTSTYNSLKLQACIRTYFQNHCIAAIKSALNAIPERTACLSSSILGKLCRNKSLPVLCIQGLAFQAVPCTEQPSPQLASASQGMDDNSEILTRTFVVAHEGYSASDDDRHTHAHSLDYSWSCQWVAVCRG